MSRLAVAVMVVLAVLVAALLGLVAILWERPTVESYTGRVVNVSDNAVVVDILGEGRIDGLLASEVEVERGDRVSVQVLSDPDVIVVTRVGDK
jgi:energy-converting hydrogenase Eha subunit A